MKANYHTHTKLCNHAEGMPEDYIKEAISLGFKEIGISDHGPVPREFMSEEEYLNNWIQRNMSLEEYYNIYLPSLDDAIAKYSDKIKIYKGLEVEYIPGHEEYYIGLKANLDYLNFGVHYFLSDGIERNSYDDVNYKTIYDYCEIAVKGMETGIYNCLVHPDLFFFNYKDEYGNQVFDKHCEAVTHKICETASRLGIYLEVNCNGIANSVKYGQMGSWLYPREEFWKIAKTYPNLKIIIGSDAHKPERIYCEDTKKIEEFCRNLELNISDYMKIED